MLGPDVLRLRARRKRITINTHITLNIIIKSFLKYIFSLIYASLLITLFGVSARSFTAFCCMIVKLLVDITKVEQEQEKEKELCHQFDGNIETLQSHSNAVVYSFLNVLIEMLSPASFFYVELTL
jgi:hypothetical protein